LPWVLQYQFFLQLRPSIVAVDKIARRSGAWIGRTIWQLISRYARVLALLFPPGLFNSVRNRLVAGESYSGEVGLAL